jgi:hypothetical protein
MTSGCGKCAKAFLIVFNMLLFFAGLVPLVFGIIALVDEAVFNQILATIPGSSVAQELIRNSAAYLIVLGVIVFTVGLLGWISACYTAKGILYLYLLLLVLIIAFEITIVVLAVAFPSTFSAAGQSLMKKSLNGLQDCQVFGNGSVSCPQTEATHLGWHVMQFELRCCGAKDVTDYRNGSVSWAPRHGAYGGGSPALAPLTCCQLNDGRLTGVKFPPLNKAESYCYEDGTTDAEYVAGGCFDAILKWIVTSFLIIIIMSVIGGLEIIVFVSTIVLLCDNSKSQVGHDDDPDYYRNRNRHNNRNNRRVHWAD